MQAKQQRLSRKYKLPSWSPSSGRTHSCKKEKKQRWERCPKNHDSAFLNPPASADAETRWVNSLMKQTNAHSLNNSRVRDSLTDSDREKQKSKFEGEESKWKHTFLVIAVCMQQASKARAEQKPLVIGLGSSLLMSSVRCTALWSTFTRLGCLSSDWRSRGKATAQVPWCQHASTLAGSHFVPHVWGRKETDCIFVRTLGCLS